MPAYTHGFAQFLWRTLVEPVLQYGMEQFTWTENDAAPTLKAQASARRRFLQLGGRAPADAVDVLANLECCTIGWRVRRATLFLR